MLIINLILIQLIVVFIIDLSGIVETAKKWVWKKAFKTIPYNEEFRMKPFDCSLCVTFWTGLIYLAIVGEFNLPAIACVCLLAFLTPIAADLLRLFKDILTKAIAKLYEWLKI